MEVLRTVNYVRAMTQTLEHRAEELEKRVAELSAQVLNLRPLIRAIRVSPNY